jgi:hypothetical protein
MNNIAIIFILLLVSAGAMADEVTKIYTVKIETAIDSVEEFLTALNKEKILKLARIDAGKLYLNTNKLEDDEFTSQLEIVSSAYIRIENIESNIVMIAGVKYQQTIAAVIINDDFLTYQLSALEKVSHLTDKVEVALKRLRLHKKKVDKNNVSFAIKNIKQAELELLNYQSQLKFTLDTKGWLKKGNKSYVIKNSKYEYSLTEKILALQLSSLWYERAINTIILPLKETMTVDIQSARMFENTQTNIEKKETSYTGDELLEGHSQYLNNGMKINNKRPNLDLLVNTSFNREVILLLSEWFHVSNNNVLSVVYNENSIENLAKETLLARLTKIPFESVIQVQNKSIAILSVNLNGKLTITKGFEDSYQIMSLPLNLTDGAILTPIASKNGVNTLVLRVLVNWRELSNMGSLSSVNITSNNLVWFL